MEASNNLLIELIEQLRNIKVFLYHLELILLIKKFPTQTTFNNKGIYSLKYLNNQNHLGFQQELAQQCHEEPSVSPSPDPVPHSACPPLAGS